MSSTKFEFVGGSLCLDLCNTIGGARGHISATEHLNSYSDILNWAHQAGLMSNGQSAQLELESRSHAVEAEAVLERTRKLREAAYRLFSAVVEGVVPLDTDLSLLNAELTCGLQHARIITTPTGFAWGWAPEVTLDTMLAPVAQATADLLTAPALYHVRKCSSQTCSWLFIDNTKNHSRRWCNMKTCGNAHKVRRFRTRQASRS